MYEIQRDGIPYTSRPTSNRLIQNLRGVSTSPRGLAAASTRSSRVLVLNRTV
ncbi:hypothetical protein PISMIDRAFT_679225 [Pisolithus microcarpus 441]|uniref:Uncharacterized protein n=1 Tax=Pisolithus microcarpus 441 TaxID=765257 RepID=A0A0C9Z3A6_9AGAM|nr:hypothetical protein PISMIDRAFT_679225 [Pisolithus microcarpus 441]